MDVEHVVDGKAVGHPIEGVLSSTGVQTETAVAAIDVPPGEAILRFTARAKDEDARRSLERRPSTSRSCPHVRSDLRSPVVRRARSALELRMLRQATASAPTASRVFRRTDRVLIDVPCYGARAAEATLTVELLNKGGQSLAKMPVPAQSEGRWQFELPVGGLVKAPTCSS